MKNRMIGIKILFLLVFAFALLSCNTQVTTDNTPTAPAFTVLFVDYDNTVLKTIDCDGVSTCTIVAPSTPNNKDNGYFTRWSIFPADFDLITADTTIKAIYTLDNRLVTIGGRSILFYSFFIMIGILTAFLLGASEVKRVGLNYDAMMDGFLWIVPVAILGSRLWYVMFELDQFVYGGFFPSLLRILGFSSGTLDFSTFGLSGLAIHGAFTTAVICVYFFARKRKIDILKAIDLIAIGFIIAQAFGRWGNFFNQEAHGGLVGGVTNGVANLSLQEQFEYLKNSLHIPQFIVNNMYIKAGLNGSSEPFTGYYHPTFFYESMLNLIGFAIMLVMRKLKKIRFGELLAFYLVWYGAVRIFIEVQRTDPLTFVLFGVTFKSAIVTSVIMIILGIGLSLLIRLVIKGKAYATVPGCFGKEADPAHENR